MRKGATTRQAILTHATGLASQIGLTGLTIGVLAEHLRLSKSGLFAHFRSKEALQLQILDHAAAAFVAAVVRPALREPRGEPRLRALFEHWMEWECGATMPGGCVFLGASSELDDRPGTVRDRLVELQRQWLAVIVTAVRHGMAAGVLRAAVDPEQFGQDLQGVMLSFHHQTRLLGDSRAAARARRAFEGLIAGARP